VSEPTINSGSQHTASGSSLCGRRTYLAVHITGARDRFGERAPPLSRLTRRRRPVVRDARVRKTPPLGCFRSREKRAGPSIVMDGDKGEKQASFGLVVSRSRVGMGGPAIRSWPRAHAGMRKKAAGHFLPWAESIVATQLPLADCLR
jgi:hypothetical protein